MALVVADRIKETTTTTGTGAISLAGAADNFAAFSSVLSDGDTTYYCIVDDTNLDYEVGLGTYASGTNTLARTTILDSSNAGSAVNLGSGTKDIFITYPADKAVYGDASGFVGIGTDTPSDSNTGANNLVVQSDTTSAGITIRTPPGYIGNLFFADGAGGSSAAYRGYVQYSHADDSLKLGSAGLPRITIKNDGDVGIGTTEPSARSTSYKAFQVESADTNAGGSIRLQNGSAVYSDIVNFSDDLYLFTDGVFYFRDHAGNAVATLFANGNFTATGALSASGYNNTNWDDAYSWGNHATAGYLTSSSSLNASNINSGTIGDAYLPATISSNITGSSASCTGNAASASTVAVTATGSSVFHRMVFTDDNNTTTTTGNLYKDSASNFYYNPSSNTLYATTFSGALSGNASTATYATSAGSASTATTATNATNSSTVTVSAGTSNANYRMIYSDATSTYGYKNIFKDDAFQFYYNPSENKFRSVAECSFGQSSSNLVRINSSTSSGIIEFNNNPAVIRCNVSTGEIRYDFQGTVKYIHTAAEFRPFNTGDASLGNYNRRWNYVFLVNSPEVSSDERTKEQIIDLDAAEKRVALAAKGLLKKYKLKQEVTDLGAGAKWHVGIIAQQLRDAFIAEGLDPNDYAMIAHREWWEAEKYTLPDENYPDGHTEIVTYDTEAEAPAGAVHKDQYSVVYEELLAFILAAI